MIPEHERHLVGVIDNYDSEGKPAGCLGENKVMNLSYKYMDDAGKSALSLICAKAKVGYYLMEQRIASERYPAKLAAMRAELADMLDRAMRMASAMVDTEG